MSNNDVKITIRTAKKRVPIDDFSMHDIKSKEGLSKLRVIDLRKLIVKHNLHAMIRKYNVMKKSELIDVLLKHGGKSTTKSESPSPAPPPSPPPSPPTSPP